MNDIYLSDRYRYDEKTCFRKEAGFLFGFLKQ